MKTKLSFLGTYILGVLALVLVMSTILCSCDRVRTTVSDESESDVLNKEYIEHITNPNFLTVNEVIEFTNRNRENAQIDSLLLSLPEPTLVNVASVVIKQCGVASKKQIYDEYNKNRSVYKNLPNQDTQQYAATNKETEVPATRVEEDVSTVYNTRDTVINGRKCTIQTKITYEQ